jgi:hypothetical protein
VTRPVFPSLRNGTSGKGADVIGPGVHERGACQRRGREAVDYFICGPGPMVAAATRIVSDRDAPSRRIHTELLDIV